MGGLLLLLAAALAGVGPAGAQDAASGDLDLMARTIAAEARGEPYTGQVAVGAVIINRTRTEGFPDTIPGVIYQPGAFEAVQNGLIWQRTPNEQEIKAARDALNGWDPTYGAIYYFNPDKTSNRFMWSLPQTLRIGKHVFSLGPQS